MAKTLSHMDYHTHEYVIASTIDFELIQDKLVEAGLIDREEISQVLNSSKSPIKQNICLLKILFEGKRDFNPFIEILGSDNNIQKHRKLAKQISAPEKLTIEEKRRFGITRQKNFEQRSLDENKLASTCNESNEFVTELFRELSFVPKCYESPENKYDTESGIYSEGDLSQDSESISEEDNNICSDPEYCESEDRKILLTRSNEIETSNPTTQEKNSHVNTVVCSDENWKVTLPKRMRRFGFTLLFPSVIIIGFIITHAILGQPTSWIRSLFKTVI